MADLKTLARLRDKVERKEQDLAKLRVERDKLVRKLAVHFPERVVGEAAGLSGSYVNALKRMARR